MRVTIPTGHSSANGNGHSADAEGHNGNGRAPKNGTRKASAARVEANRRNARRSTGPRTGEGKRRASMNALKHGACSSSPLLPNECAATYDTFRAEIRDDLRPRTAVEMILVDQITGALWRLRRVGDVERSVMRIERERLENGARAKPAKMQLAPRLAGLGEDEAARDGGATDRGAPDEMWPCEVMARCFASENAQGSPLMLLQRYERSLQNTLMRLMARLDVLKNRKNSDLYDRDEPPVPREYDRPVPPPPPPPPRAIPAPAPVRNEANTDDEDEECSSADAERADASERNEAKAPAGASVITPSPGTPGEGRGEDSSTSARSSTLRQNLHPIPLPDYRARGPERKPPTQPPPRPD